MKVHAITVYPLQNRILMIKYSDSSVAATLHSSGESLHLRCCSKPSSQLPGPFQLSQNDVLWGGFWAWGIKRNRTEPSQGCTVGGEALWYCVEPKIHSQRMMCDLAHCRGEGTSFAQIFLACRSSVIIRWTSVFGSPTSSAINCTLKRWSLSRTAFTRATLFSVLEVEVRPARCSSSTLSLPSLNALCHLWGLGLKTKQQPHKLSSTTATFRNQIFRVSHRTWSRNSAPDSSAFSPVTRRKNYYALCQRTDCYKGSPSTCLDPQFPFLALPRCAKNHSHYFWDRLRSFPFSYVPGSHSHYKSFILWIVYWC